LRWNDLRELALDKAYPSTLDITQQAPREFALRLLREVLQAHPESRYVHLGMDEAHALVSYSKANGLDVVTVFLDYLETLCAECERFNVKPVIWSDMLEDHFSPTLLERFRAFTDRVVLCSWDYGADGSRTASARINGNRVAKFWRDNPTAEGAPAMNASTLFVEDLDDATREFLAPYFDGKTFAPLFWCDAWRAMGFEVWGASASRTSGDAAILPKYNSHVANVRAWSQARQRSGASAHVVTSWARGTTFCPPNFSFDASWFSLQAAAIAEGKEYSDFFPGIEPQTVTRIFQTLGRCREEWRLETVVADEMDALASRLTAHQFEWRGVSLLARVLGWTRRLEFAIEEVTYFECNDLLPDGEWTRRLSEHAAIVSDGAVLREQVSTHFGQRYTGAAHEEWLRDIFERPLERLKSFSLACDNNLKNSLSRYAR
jgi:hypothetical protein